MAKKRSAPEKSRPSDPIPSSSTEPTPSPRKPAKRSTRKAGRAAATEPPDPSGSTAPQAADAAASPAVADSATPLARDEQKQKQKTKARGTRAPGSARSGPASPSRSARSGTSRRAARPSVSSSAAEAIGAGAPPLHVVFIASEAHPFATTGGLAEVAGALPLAVARLGHTATIIVPHYPQAAARRPSSGLPPLRTPDAALDIDLGGGSQTVRFHRHAVQEGVTVVLVDVPELFDREGLYGTGDEDYPDNGFRFALFSRAALEYLRHRGERPSVIHAHDWQTGLVPAYQKMLFSPDPTVGGVPVVFTVHNLAFQGIYPASSLGHIGLPDEVLHIQAMEFWGKINYLKAGINFSERITTVSPTYARQILAPENGCGLDGVLARRAADLAGILNGIDTAQWNPAADQHLPASYSRDDLTGKQDAKRALLEAAGLKPADGRLERPLIAMVSRLTDQKGLDLFAAAADDLMDLGATWVLHGSGEARYEELWMSLASRFPDRVWARIGYEEPLEHLIAAGADMFLMPSRFEPCGLNQLHSLRYGTLPIVRATGGLDDTVADAGSLDGEGTGFKFGDYTPEALIGAVRRALDAFGDATAWQRLQRNAMGRDYSWDSAAREYVKVYRALS